MENLTTIPQKHFQHFSEANAFKSRVKLIRELIEVSKRKAEWHIFTSNLLGGLNPSRDRLDFEVAQRLFEWICDHVPYRRDIVDVETIKIPEISIKVGADCDDFVVLSGTMLESVGIPVKISVSQQMGDGTYDHIFLWLPTCQGIFDPTTSPQVFPAIQMNYNQMKVIE